jgi:hypothetical protein
MSKAGINTINTGTQSVTAGGTISLGSIAHRYGNRCGSPIIDLNGSGISITERGLYRVNASITVSPTAAGSVTVTLYRDGAAVPGGTASSSVSTAGNPVNLSIVRDVRNLSDCVGSVLTLVLTGTTSTVNNVSVEVEKL